MSSPSPSRTPEHQHRPTMRRGVISGENIIIYGGTFILNVSGTDQGELDTSIGSPSLAHADCPPESPTLLSDIISENIPEIQETSKDTIAGPSSEQSISKFPVSEKAFSTTISHNHGQSFDRDSTTSWQILHEAVATRALYNSGIRFDPPKCHPTTRVALLQKTLDWITRRCDSKTMDRSIMWLTGGAGEGKSAIAQSLVELCHDENLLLGNFFCGRSDGTRNNARAFVATLAYQILRLAPAVETQILSVIENDPLIFERSLDVQFKQLIVEPLSSLCTTNSTQQSMSNRVIVIDGLDELLNVQQQVEIIQIISCAIRESHLPVLFFITSRPELQIVRQFSSYEMVGIYERLLLGNDYGPNEDIRQFLEQSFAEIRESNAVSPQWPSNEDILALVQKSHGQFVYAATAVKYIQSTPHQPLDELQNVLNTVPDNGGSSGPFAELDALYSMILSSVPNTNRVLYALGMAIFNVASSPHLDVREFMKLDVGLDTFFSRLNGTLVRVEGPRMSNFCILHASFQDFLQDRSRSKKYFMPIESYRTQYLAQILTYIGQSDDRDHRIALTGNFFTDNYQKCQSSPDLLQSASSLPLMDIFEELNGYGDYDGKNFILFTFFAFLRRMARLDKHKRWAVIQKQHEEALDTIFLSQISHYYEDDCFIAMLCLVVHAGTDKLVPGFYYNEEHAWRITIRHSQRHIFSRDVHNDSLLLSSISLSNIGADLDHYRQSLIAFLKDAGRSGEYAIGGYAYTRAAFYCIIKLGRLFLQPQQEADRFSENYLSEQLIFDDGIWRLHLSSANADSEVSTTTSEIYFILLGYASFFLPRSGWYEPLVKRCRQATFLTSPLSNIFPQRTTVLCKAIEDYLERVDVESSEASIEVAAMRKIIRSM